jgi:hypothetical protein
VIILKGTTHWQGVSGDANTQLLEGIEWLWTGGNAKIQP